MNFNKYKKVLVVAVGGGNDSVSTILLQLQLQKMFNYNPENVDIVAVLPDCLEYHNLIKTEHSLLSVITEKTTRSVNGKMIPAFPEPILAANKQYFSTLNIKNIFGISMSDGSIGVANTLKFIVNNYDLILAIDVGGDFIAHKNNVEVLSPMMDGYMLYTFKELKKYIHMNSLGVDIVFSVFGLGTDGESTPEMLDKALSLVDYSEYDFNQEDVKDFFDFYRNKVEPNRYSRTTDYTIKEIMNDKHDNPSIFRGRFHVKNGNGTNKYYGNFSHFQDEKYYGKFYLFTNISNVENFYSIACNSGYEWFINVQNQHKINHELNGQFYLMKNIFSDKKYKTETLFFGTPSRKFNNIEEINKDISNALKNDLYDYVIIYSEYEYLFSEFNKNKVTEYLTMVWK